MYDWDDHGFSVIGREDRKEELKVEKEEGKKRKGKNIYRSDMWQMKVTCWTLPLVWGNRRDVGCVGGPTQNSAFYIINQIIICKVVRVKYNHLFLLISLTCTFLFLRIKVHFSHFWLKMTKGGKKIWFIGSISTVQWF